jgi:hypothetical protein
MVMMEGDFVLELSKEAFLVSLSRFMMMMMEGDCVLELRKEAFLLGGLFFFSCIEED